jgi:hypothetical protein
MQLEQKIMAFNGESNITNEPTEQPIFQKTEHDKITNELIDQIEFLRAKIQMSKIDKNALDNKLLESEIFQKLVIQVQAVVAYCGYLKQRTEKAESNILEIEKMRAFELNDLQLKENEQKLNLVRNNKVLERELTKVKEAKTQLQLELSLKINALKALENIHPDRANSMMAIETND